MENQPQMPPVQPTTPQPQPPMQQPPVTSPQEPSRKKSLLWLWITLAVLALLAALAVIFFMFIYPSLSKKSATTSTTQSSQTNESNNTTNTLASTCLMVSDLKDSGITYIEAVSLKSGANSGMPIYYDNLYFVANSTDYLSESAATESFNTAATLYKNAAKKEFTYTLKGYEHQIDGSTSDLSMATQRANKAKAQMVSLGIPESRITVLDPEVTSNDSDYNDIDRKIEIGILIPSSCVDAY